MSIHQSLIPSSNAGSLLQSLVSRPDSPVNPASIYATVRGKGQAESLASLGVHPVSVDLKDEAAVKGMVLDTQSASV